MINSALFCQEVVGYLLDKYADRFALYEHTRINKVVLKEELVLLDAVEHTVECAEVILCTNGFDTLEIFAPSGLSIDTRFHYSIEGVIGFMSGFLEKFEDPPMANCYFHKEWSFTAIEEDPYLYVTRRPYEYDKDTKHNLICIGGPEYSLESTHKYSRDFDFPENAFEKGDTSTFGSK